MERAGKHRSPRLPMLSRLMNEGGRPNLNGPGGDRDGHVNARGRTGKTDRDCGQGPPRRTKATIAHYKSLARMVPGTGCSQPCVRRTRHRMRLCAV